MIFHAETVSIKLLLAYSIADKHLKGQYVHILLNKVQEKYALKKQNMLHYYSLFSAD